MRDLAAGGAHGPCPPGGPAGRYVSHVARVREFDEQALLDGAQELFRSHGFDPGSSYAAYGTELNLFLPHPRRVSGRG
jgi:hypothetical protein